MMRGEKSISEGEKKFLALFFYVILKFIEGSQRALSR
jgi:wobble nucleotide-excising tRNase